MIFYILKEFKERKIFLHLILSGGIYFIPSLEKMNEIISFGKRNFNYILWESFFHGENSYEGKFFKETKFFIKNKDTFYKVIELPKIGSFLERRDFYIAWKKKIRFCEILDSPKLNFIDKQRLINFERKIFNFYFLEDFFNE